MDATERKALVDALITELKSQGLVIAPAVSAPPVAKTADILTREEAKAYVKRPSEGAFSAWCRKFQYRPAERGRHSRPALDRALDREARRRG